MNSTKAKVAEQVIDIVSNKGVVRDGPHLWVSKLLQTKGPMSSKKIWEEFLKDPTVSKDIIKSRSFLKERILYTMMMQGKIVRGKAIDMPQFNNAGWKVVPQKAFKNVTLDIVSQLDPLPVMQRKDYKDYLR